MACPGSPFAARRDTSPAGRGCSQAGRLDTHGRWASNHPRRSLEVRIAPTARCDRSAIVPQYPASRR